MSDHHIILPQILPNSVGDVDHSSLLSESIGRLFDFEDFSDITLIVEKQQFTAHKVVLAARSNYFRALLFGGMRESSSREIELKGVSALPFKHLLKYIYTGKLSLTQFKSHNTAGTTEDILLEILGLAHQYDFRQLETAISDYLKAVLNTSNVCMIYDMANLYKLSSLEENCLEFIDRNAAIVMESEQFYTLTDEAMKRVISRDSFYAPEVDIFRAVYLWLRRQSTTSVSEDTSEQDDKYLSTLRDSDNSSDDSDDNPLLVMAAKCVHIVDEIRLSLMSLNELLNIVRPSQIVSPDAILDAIQLKNDTRSAELAYRGFLIPEENIATSMYGASVIRGECRADLLNGDTQNYDLDRGFTRHAIDDNSQIVVKLGKPCIINTIRLLLWDKDMRSYSYYIEVSMDETDWVRVIDRRSFLCRSWQNLHFTQRVVNFIRVVGTHNSVNRVFHAVALEAMYAKEAFDLAENGLEIPRYNVATTNRSACVLEGVSRTRNALISGDASNYDWDSGYTCHQLGNGAIVVQLSQPYVVSTMRLLLWDCDDRAYSYTVEVSTNQTDWVTICDRSQELCSSWQFIQFEARPVSFVRIVGVQNTANEVFHVVHFECPCSEDVIKRYTIDQNTHQSGRSSSSIHSEHSEIEAPHSNSLLPDVGMG